MKFRTTARAGAKILAAAAVVALTTAFIGVASSASADPTQQKPAQMGTTISSTGLKAGQVKHVWLIILENKSYDATFTGLNQNSYLWKTLPAQGVLLKNYYGTGHFSQDNYISMVSGQSAQQDTQSDCSVEDYDFGSNASIITRRPARTPPTTARSPRWPTPRSPAGPTLRTGTNGCTYPTDAPTLFNQLDAAGKTWKGYAQDLGNQPGREDAACGGPGTAANNPTTNPTFMSATAAHPFPAGVTSFTGAQANDQYVAKHFPFPWFHAITGTVTAAGRTTPGLTTPAERRHRLRRQPHRQPRQPARAACSRICRHESTTPAFSWITPNNCSDAHDAICKGNNLSGAVHADRPADLPDRRAEPGADDAEELHRRPVRLGSVPAVLHPDDREVRRRSRTAA